MAPNPAKRGALRALSLMMTAAVLTLVSMPAHAASPGDLGVPVPAPDGALVCNIASGFGEPPCGPLNGLLNLACHYLTTIPGILCDILI